MEAYRDQYAKVTEKGAQVVAISVDDVETLKKFKESLNAPFTFLSDPGGKVASLYGGMMGDKGVANRATFVVNQDGTIAHTEEGMAALNPGAIEACPRKDAPKTI
jgi:thioredoxin-dependent peroxiredoxin